MRIKVCPLCSETASLLLSICDNWNEVNGCSSFTISFPPYRLYRVSHGKLNKVIWLCWGYRFLLLLKFWVLCVYEILPSLSVFIQFIFHSICGPIYKYLLFFSEFLIILNFRGNFKQWKVADLPWIKSGKPKSIKNPKNVKIKKSKIALQ